MNADQIADRKALLRTRADLDRTRITLAAREIRSLVVPRVTAVRVAAWRPRAAMLIAFAAPLVGMRRLSRLVRVASYAMLGIRLARNWRRNP